MKDYGSVVGIRREWDGCALGCCEEKEREREGMRWSTREKMKKRMVIEEEEDDGSRAPEEEELMKNVVS